MTANSAERAAPAPEKKKEATLREKLPPAHVAAQVAGTLMCTTLLSFLGTAGTIAGLATGAALSATLPTVIEHVTVQSAAAARARYRKYRKRGLTPDQAVKAARAETVTMKAYRPWSARRAYAVAAIAVLVTFGVSALALTGIEKVAGKPVADIVRGKAGHGTTLTGTTPVTSPPAPSYTPSYAPSPTPTPSATSSPSPTATATASASASSSATATTPMPTQTVTVTASAPSSNAPAATASPSAAAMPTGASSPSPTASADPAPTASGAPVQGQPGQSGSARGVSRWP